MAKFYVYMYLRSRDSEHGAKGTPYYIGKGCASRAYHSHGRRVSRPPSKENVVIVADRLSESEAFSEEMRLIFLRGRIDNGTGCLINLTDGGEGASGAKYSEERKLLASERLKHQWKTGKRTGISLVGHRTSERVRERARNMNRGVKFSDETRVKMSLSALSRAPMSDETRARMSQAHKGKKHSEETKLRLVSAWEVRRQNILPVKEAMYA